MIIDNEFYQTHQRRGGIFICITAFARTVGLLTLIGLGFVTYLEWIGEGSLNFRIYITIVTFIVAYLELLWIFDKFLTCCIDCFRSETCFYWICCIAIDNWVRTMIYIGLALPFLIPPWHLSTIRIDLHVVGTLLIITGILYFIKTFKYKENNPDEINEDTTILSASNSFSQPSVSTQTVTTMGINNDQDMKP
ncbi:unnamed protein product [Adineta steineri]|uniref:Uncharacterized protein n=2 Tax=Adineta steineri TaxID=433720 RepID=A0A818H900_9BILA|nr:unnamed protein product [Adineta steineri]CAF3500580.1 unnamed protein product [Adineta steineri]CAF3768241.1 unnamed protein product [Adineta steineri]